MLLKVCRRKGIHEEIIKNVSMAKNSSIRAILAENIRNWRSRKGWSQEEFANQCGALHDWTGSYLISFALSTLVLAGSDICIWLAAVSWVAAYDQRLWAKQRG